MSELDNPAARIERILRLAEPLTNREGLAVDGWKKVLGADTTEDLFTFIAEFVTLIRVARDAVSRLPEVEDPEHLLAQFPLLERIADSLLSIKSQGMKHYRGLITETLMYSLGGCSRALRRNGHKEPTIYEDGLRDLQDLVRDTISEALHSSLPEEVKIFVVQRLRDVQAALFAYEISGYSGVERTLDSMIGAAWRTPPEAAPTVGNWFIKILTRLNLATKSAAEIGTSTQRMIESVQTITGS